MVSFVVVFVVARIVCVCWRVARCVGVRVGRVGEGGLKPMREAQMMAKKLVEVVIYIFKKRVL